MPNSLKNIKFIDLFAGIGGFHQAMASFGAQCVFASEWDKHAQTVYYENYGIMPKGDITQISSDEIPVHDVLCAGFPCQAFSISGKQQGFTDARGTLFFDVLRIAKHHKPKVLFLENVRNFERHDNGRTLNIVKTELKNIGYRVFHKVLNANQFGLPQNRERIFIIAINNELNVKYFNFPQPLARTTALIDILEKQPRNAKIIDRPDIVMTRNFEPCVSIFGELELPNRPIQIGYVNKGGQGERIYSAYGHAITLSAYGGGIGAKTGLYLINKQIRKLSPRECARLQGFGDDFKIVSSVAQSYKQFGNSVAVNVLQEIIKKIIKSNCLSKISIHNCEERANN